MLKIDRENHRIIINLLFFKLKLTTNFEKFFIKKFFFLWLFFDYIIPKNKNRVVFYLTGKRENNSLPYYRYLKNQCNGEYELYTITNESINKFNSLYLMFSSKYVVFTHACQFVDYFKSSKHVYLNLWHGMPIKTLGFNESILPKFMLKRYEFLGKHSLMFATSDLFKQILIPCFKINYNNVFVTGQSRTDVIGNSSNDKLLENKFKLNSYKKIVLYMPTWKIAAAKMEKQISKEFNNIFYLNDFNENNFIETIEDNNILFLMKPHPLEEDFYKENQNLLPLSKNFQILYDEDLEGLDIYELFKYTDLMISDYSSVTIDYLLLNKPVLYLDNLSDDYKNTRGFILEDNYKILMPGAQVNNFNQFKEELLENLINDKYKFEREKSIPLIHKYIDFNSNKRIYEIMRDF